MTDNSLASTIDGCVQRGDIHYGKLTWESIAYIDL